MTLEASNAVPSRADRARARCAVGAARALTGLPPRHLRRILEFARRGSRPADKGAVLRARNAVVSVSVPCAGPRCLQRSIAIALLCRWTGSWPDWYVGVCTEPFRAHAWVGAVGRAVGEDPNQIPFFHVVMAVPARSESDRASIA